MMRISRVCPLETDAPAASGRLGMRREKARTRRWLKEEAPGQHLEATRWGIFPRMPSLWLGRMDQKSLIRVLQPKGPVHVTFTYSGADPSLD
jgi:hypothetical protein